LKTYFFRQNCEAEVLGLWFILIKDINTYASENESALPILQSSIKLAKHLIYIADEVLSAGFLSFMKPAKKTISLRYCTIHFSILFLLCLLFVPLDRLSCA
jgi:hypothetical protein